MRLSITDKGTLSLRVSLPLSSKKTPRFGSRGWLVGVNWPEIDSNHKTRDETDILPSVSSQAGLSVAPLRPTPKVRPRPVEGKSDASNHDGRRMAGSSMSGDSGSEHADQQKHLHIPYLERLRRSESPSLFRASFEEEHVNSSNNQRLVSTWSSDTLSLLALGKPGNSFMQTYISFVSSYA
ncbi:hypothetical protein PGT21_032372 [Puccinia graminis f. sp. tritici]|uniref:Uncharacterized protein n=1 Tax=Puccinia graminis f. sp. tritici TaxID=56615 RepID=A0A5B0MHM8_PUCGR|nr:hypothetical protein PGT21_032372 [Puccinia graminis f. sp. tritici]